MSNIEIIKENCSACGGNYSHCVFSIETHKGKKDSITGFYVANVDKNSNNKCTVYCGFM